MSQAKPTDRPRGVLRMALLAAICALSVALVHVAHDSIRLHVFERFTWTSRDFLWMAPLAYLIYFLVLTVVAAPFKRAGEMLIASFAVWSVLLLWTTLHPLANIIVSLGLGSVLSSVWQRFSNLQLRRTVTALGGATVLVAAVGSIVPRFARAAARNAPPGAEAPNVLLLILDTVRAKSMSLYGYERPTTPNLSRLGRESIVFDNAFATSSWSLPSHASILTGLWPHEQGGSYVHPIRRDARSVAEVFRDHGYATGGFTANVGFAGHQTGLARGFDHFEDFPRSLAQILLAPTFSQIQAVRAAALNLKGGYMRGALFAFRPSNLRLVGVRQAPNRPAADIIPRFHRWRRSLDGDGRPFFAFINLMEAHSPYEPPEPFRSAFGSPQREQDRYDGAIAYLDSVVSKLVGELDNTIVVITSDHGEQWGENGFGGHGNTLYLTALRVPLIVRATGALPALRVTQPVSLRDLPATLLDLANIRAPFAGTTLRTVWTKGETRPVFSEATKGVNVPQNSQTFLGPVRSVLDSAAHYIRLADNREELYDWRNDPDERTNVIAEPRYGGVLPNYRRLLDSLYRAPD